MGVNTIFIHMNKSYYLFFLLLTSSIVGCSQDTVEKPKKAKAEHLVETSIAEIVDTAVTLSRTGSLRARREVKLFTQEAGRITELPYYEGDRVKKGDVVARLDDKLIQAQLNRAQATRRKAQQDLRRMQDLYKKKLASDENLARSETELEVAKADEEVFVTRLGYTKLVAPINGVVSKRLTDPENIAEVYTHILTISDPTSLITEVTVSELLLPHLSLGDTTQVRIDALGQNSFTGHISRIHPSLDPNTRLGTIEIELKPVPKGALPGQLCRVELTTRSSRRLMIPFRALRQGLHGDYVYSLDKDSQVKYQEIETGVRVGEQVEVLSGLIEGQQVITKGFLNLAADMKVTVISPSAPSVTKPSSPENAEQKAHATEQH